MTYSLTHPLGALTAFAAAALAAVVLTAPAQAAPAKAMHGKMAAGKMVSLYQADKCQMYFTPRPGQEARLCLPSQQGQDEAGQGHGRRRQGRDRQDDR